MYPFPDTNRSIPSTGALFSLALVYSGIRYRPAITRGCYSYFSCVYSIVRLEITSSNTAYMYKYITTLNMAPYTDAMKHSKLM